MNLSFMVNRLWLIVLLSSLLLVSTTIIIKNSWAQTSPIASVAVNVEVKDTDASAGDIISATRDGFKKATQAYDVAIYGVVTSAPIISVRPKTDNTRAVVSAGEALVRVSTANGEIKDGDLITSSTTAGVGQKATQPGYIVGKALGSYNDSSKPGLVPIIVNLSFFGGSSASGGVGSLLNLVASPANPRYLFAAIIGIIVLILATIATIRLVTSGVTAVGRNPLARGTIYRTMIIAGLVVIILAIAGAGVVIAIITLGGQ